MPSRRTKLAQRLRKESTPAEKMMWGHLQKKQLDGMKFRRQEPIGPYIADFVCYERLVVIEMDGGQHGKEERKLKDNTRDDWLHKNGYTVLRFRNNEVMKNLDGVLKTIQRHCMNR